jgi:hypothetical protein
MDTRAKQRVAIAKDALAWIEAGALEPTTGLFISPSRADCYSSKGQLRDTVLGKCHVCALGSLLLAKAVRFDNVLCNQMNYLNTRMGVGPIADHFDRNQLLLIESAFEGYSDEDNDVQIFYSKYPDPKDRLVAILKNLIKNKGTFKP